MFDKSFLDTKNEVIAKQKDTIEKLNRIIKDFISIQIPKTKKSRYDFVKELCRKYDLDYNQGFGFFEK